jgi:hypothetical protein
MQRLGPVSYGRLLWPMVGDSGRKDNVAFGKIGRFKAESKRKSLKRHRVGSLQARVIKDLGGLFRAGRRLETFLRPAGSLIWMQKDLHGIPVSS